MRTDCPVGSLADYAGSLADDAEAALGDSLLLLERRARQLNSPVALPRRSGSLTGGIAGGRSRATCGVEGRSRPECVQKEYQDPTSIVRILAPLDFYIALLYPKQLSFILIACLITWQLRQLLIATLVPLDRRGSS